ncbi:MAG TPA: DUF2218 domain-containing protein [Pseudomonas sp.]|jgi:hypothetical protein|nr:DUF2218 domain-containing protein [Pseudomonas sp.]
MNNSVATIDTADPQRLIRRLSRHWSHKFPVRQEQKRSEIRLTLGDCLLEAGEATLRVRLQAADEEVLPRFEAVVVSHLQRMAAGPLPEFLWQRQTHQEYP